ncbi:MAG: MFS transporter [Acidobacteria bacterium]|nr:MFS transporter [Acidobacteriota bacterium]
MNSSEPIEGAGSPIKSPARNLYLSVCATAFSAYASYSLVRTPVLPLYARHLGLSTELVGFVVAASTVTGIFLKLPAGTLSDVFGRRRMLFIGALVFAIAPFFYILPHNASSLIAVRLIHGSATAIFGPVMAAVISDLAPAQRRGSWLGTYAASQGAGNAMGQLLGGVLLSLGGFAYPFLTGGVCGVVALALLPRVGSSPTLKTATPALHRLRSSLRLILSDRMILLISLATAGQYLGNGALNAFLPLYADQVAGLPAWQIGLLFGAQTGSLLAFRPLLGKLSDRWGRPPLMVAGMMASALGLLMLPFLRTFAALIALAVGYGAAFAATSATSLAWITDRATRSSYGTAHGAYGTIFDVGDASGPIAAGLLIGSIGYGAGFRLLAVPLILLSALLAWRGRARADGFSSS